MWGEPVSTKRFDYDFVPSVKPEGLCSGENKQSFGPSLSVSGRNNVPRVLTAPIKDPTQEFTASLSCMPLHSRQVSVFQMPEHREMPLMHNKALVLVQELSGGFVFSFTRFCAKSAGGEMTQRPGWSSNCQYFHQWQVAILPFGENICILHFTKSIDRKSTNLTSNFSEKKIYIYWKK